MASSLATSRMLICNCEKTMDIDAARLKVAFGLESEPTIFTNLCRNQIEAYGTALKSGEPLLVACTQEAPLFRELGDEMGRSNVEFTNIRERAGWCAKGADANAKIAALLAEAHYQPRPARLTTIKSSGLCLVYGAGQQALDVAQQLSSRLNVSVVLTDVDDIIPPSVANVPIYKGQISKAAGTLGNFEVVVNGYAPTQPSSRDSLEFVMARDGASSKCDVIFDMSGSSPLFKDADRRDGYVRVDPRQPLALATAMLEATDLIGEFEKPLYVDYDRDICAHARSGQVGCSNCLDNCPVSAIAPDGDGVVIDHMVCGGCGNCSASCPTGAVSYAYPPRNDTVTRAKILLQTFLAAGGRQPILLLHDESHGAEQIAAIARFGEGLPAHVIPMSTYSVLQLGHEVIAAFFALGACQVAILVSPQHPEEAATLQQQIALANTLMAGMGYQDLRALIISERDPDAAASALAELVPGKGISHRAFMIGESKREIARTALARLHEEAPQKVDAIALASGAPYGSITIDTAGCTLCLSCVSACPTGALSDNPDQPQVSFTELSCVQCGLCRTTCPESVISLTPRYSFSDDVLRPEVLNEESPFECISCGKPFGTKSSIEKVIAALKGKHAMFQNEEQVQVIQMCDDCRVIAIANAGNDPMSLGEPPRVRTTDDYIREAEEMDRSSDVTDKEQ